MTGSTPAPISLPTWPNGAQVAVSLTFDVDAEAGVLAEGAEFTTRLTALSEGRYGVQRGLNRILATLADVDVPATFYVPGYTAEQHPAVLKDLLSAGHEVGHHGYLHLPSHRLDTAAQTEEIQRGTAAIVDNLGVRPTGYRSPYWELTPHTFQLVADQFLYDSSCMGDDRPYFETLGERRILELPVHWSLDDWPHFAWAPSSGGALHHPDQVLDVWLREFDCAIQERRHVTYTMHPEVIGRGHRADLIRRMVEEMRARADVWFAPHHAVATHVLEAT